jgi:hypothetical protein
MPQVGRRLTLEPSIIPQIDGLLHCCLGARIEIDVCAHRQDLAHTDPFAILPWESLGSVFGLYLHDWQHMPSVVAVAASHRAAGVFVVLANQGTDEPLIRVAGTTIDVPWFGFLMKHAKLVFHIPRSSVKDMESAFDVVAVVADFGRNSVFKRKQRQEKRLSLSSVAGVSRLLSPIPCLFHQLSPDVVPLPEDTDVARRAPTFGPCAQVDLGALQPSAWPVDDFADSSVDYPCQMTRNLALQVMKGELDPFVGDRSKPVDCVDRVYDSGEALVIRSKWLDLVEKGWAVGPSPWPFFPNSRVWPSGTVKKNKYNASCTEVRMKSDYSDGLCSINDLCWSPDLLRPSVSAQLIGDVIIWSGRGTQVTVRDVPKAFKLNKANHELLFLHTSRLISAEFGTEFFLSLANDFGWSPSEWGWQCVLALIL